MKDYIDPYLVKKFCELVSHQLSLQNSQDGRFDIPIPKVFDILGPNDPGDFPFECVKTPLKKLLSLNPELGLKFLGYRRSFVRDREMALVPATLDKIARLEPSHIYYEEPEVFSFEIDQKKFEDAYHYYCQQPKEALFRDPKLHIEAREVLCTVLKEVSYKEGLLIYRDETDKEGEMFIARDGSVVRKIFEFLWQTRYELKNKGGKTYKNGDDHSLSNIQRLVGSESEKSVQVQINKLNKRFLEQGIKISIEKVGAGKQRRLVVYRD